MVEIPVNRSNGRGIRWVSSGVDEEEEKQRWEEEDRVATHGRFEREKGETFWSFASFGGCFNVISISCLLLLQSPVREKVKPNLKRCVNNQRNTESDLKKSQSQKWLQMGFNFAFLSNFLCQ